MNKGKSKKKMNSYLKMILLMAAGGVVGGIVGFVTAFSGDTLENGDMVKVYGDGNMTKSIPASYPGVTKMKRNGRATLEELQPYLEIANGLLCGDSEEEDKK